MTIREYAPKWGIKIFFNGHMYLVSVYIVPY